MLDNHHQAMKKLDANGDGRVDRQVVEHAVGVAEAVDVVDPPSHADGPVHRRDAKKTLENQ